MTRAARVKAFAKINVGLRVLYRRPDGYHELRTVFQTVSLADTLDIAWTPGRSSSVSVEGAPEIADNIAARAAHRVLDHFQVRGSVRIGLQKKIPSGAGLGGGSSDAAAVLLALPVLMGKSPIPAAIAAELGSDVPFFLYGGRALGLGRGEELYPLPEPAPSKGLLVVPDIHSSTAEAYRDLSEKLTLIALQNKLSTFQTELWQSGKAVSGGHGRPEAINDFEAVVCARYPGIGTIRDRLQRLGASPAAMSGSGSAVFGIFNDPERLRRARVAFPDERCFPISFLSRRQYRAHWRRALASHLKPHPRAGADEWPPLSRYGG
jgi:4-diphosphocytidyl-2-C-methyl-D-erythritol kinase